ncbi:unnamed protein product [Adineta steineri]|uniref:Mitochondrial import receptor subunit TOM40 n=1 Tax=Adineta steineri TaxID=433720 RepID=A0A813P6Q4_9BILA|nr:unnamed protein product [Adineta steineri]CAF3488356.1 unnamed protein product [Adineta steineri]
MSTDDCYINRPIKKTIQVLDSELRLRSLTNSSDCRFDELTNFFNIINGLFHQSAFTFGLSTDKLTSLLQLPRINVGINMQQYKLDLLKNITFYSLIGRNETNTSTGIIKFHTYDKNLMLSINHRWTESLTTAFRLRTKPQIKFSSHIEYHYPKGICELISEYETQQHSSNIQFSYFACLWQQMNYRIDGGIDFKVKNNNSNEKLADIGLRLKHSSDSLIFKYDLYNPFKNYIIGIQRCINENLTIGLLTEKVIDYDQQQKPIKFSFMSQWYLNKIDLRVNTLVNTQNEMGIALTHQIRHLPVVLQAFSLYSWSTHKYKWGIGLQLSL